MASPFEFPVPETEGFSLFRPPLEGRTNVPQDRLYVKLEYRDSARLAGLPARWVSLVNLWYLYDIGALHGVLCRRALVLR